MLVCATQSTEADRDGYPLVLTRLDTVMAATEGDPDWWSG